MNIVLVTGLSGAGKSQTKYALEDLGYFCVDNLPPRLMPAFADYMDKNSSEYPMAAIVVDIRGGRFFSELENSLNILEQAGHCILVLFVEASDDTLLKRFKENRRTHPLEREMTFEKAIASERMMLRGLRKKADCIINTDSTTNAQLRNKVADAVGVSAADNFLVTLASFGFKYGPKKESDFVFDLRYLPNPYYDEKLKHRTGNEKEVQDFVMASPVSQEVYQNIYELLKNALPHIIKDGRRGVYISFGCTGGRQRSVTFANLFKKALTEAGYEVKVVHRDLEE